MCLPRQGGQQLLQQLHQEQRYPRLIRIWVDGGYGGKNFVEWVFDLCWWIIEVVQRREGTAGFVVLPRRWTVERT